MASSNYGVPITPATLKDGTLRASLDPVTNPQSTGYGAVNVTGTAKVGGAASAENSLAPRPTDPGVQDSEPEEGAAGTGTEAGTGAVG